MGTSSKSVQRMNIPARRQGLTPPVSFQPQSILDKLADVMQVYPAHRLFLDQPLSFLRTHGKNQLEILAVLQRVVQRRTAIVHRSRLFADRDSFRAQHQATTTFLAEVPGVEAI